jgi:hypothetical protein
MVERFRPTHYPEPSLTRTNHVGGVGVSQMSALVVQRNEARTHLKPQRRFETNDRYPGACG